MVIIYGNPMNLNKEKNSFVDELKAKFKFHDYGFIDDV